MQNIFGMAFFFLTYTVLAFWQALTTAGEFALIKDLGMGGAFIVTCIFMFRYFTKQVETKDQAMHEITEKFIEMTNKFAERETLHYELMKDVRETLREVKKK